MTGKVWTVGFGGYADGSWWNTKEKAIQVAEETAKKHPGKDVIIFEAIMVVRGSEVVVGRKKI